MISGSLPSPTAKTCGSAEIFCIIGCPDHCKAGRITFRTRQRVEIAPLPRQSGKKCFFFITNYGATLTGFDVSPLILGPSCRTFFRWGFEIHACLNRITIRHDIIGLRSPAGPQFLRFVEKNQHKKWEPTINKNPTGCRYTSRAARGGAGSFKR